MTRFPDGNSNLSEVEWWEFEMGQCRKSLKHVSGCYLWPGEQSRKSRFLSGNDKNKVKVTESSSARKRLMYQQY